MEEPDSCAALSPPVRVIGVNRVWLRCAHPAARSFRLDRDLVSDSRRCTPGEDSAGGGRIGRGGMGTR